MRWLLWKDIRILRRSPQLVGLLIVYPIAIALLIGLALSRGPSKPRIALLNEIPSNQRVLQLGSRSVNISSYEKLLAQAVTPIPVSSRAQAVADVDSGDALAALIIPPDLVQRLSSGISSGNVEVIYNGDALKQSLVHETIDAKIGDANAALAHTLAQIASGYVDLLRSGGQLQLPGGNVSVLGLRSSQTLLNAALATLPRGSVARAAVAPVAQFAALAVANLGFAKKALTAVAQPIAVTETVVHGTRTPLDTFAVAVAVAISIMFVCVLLAAGMLALEREEHTFARLVRDLVRREVLLAEKVVLAAGCAFAVGLLMLCGVGIFVPLDWGRFPLWVLAIAGSALGFATLGVTIGALTREVRAASLLSFLLALPLAFLALVPSGAVAGGLYDVVRVVSAIFPFQPALDAIDAAVNDSQPGLAASLAHIAAVILGFSVIARLALRRF